MGTYENGTFTRMGIVQVCKRLFYEKGYHETTNSDICRMAHINRGTLYYHFPSKEAIRYEVQWEYIMDNKHLVEKYCPDERYHFLLAMCIFWKQLQKDENMRRFSRQLYTDFPAYTGKKDMTFFYYTCYEHMWENLWKHTEISQLAFASVYGYVMGCIRMLCEHPDTYDPIELFIHCSKSSMAIWGIPEEKSREIWPKFQDYLARIPEDEMGMRF